MIDERNPHKDPDQSNGKVIDILRGTACIGLILAVAYVMMKYVL
jgi:hypothetical protein